MNYDIFVEWSSCILITRTTSAMIVMGWHKQVMITSDDWCHRWSLGPIMCLGVIPCWMNPVAKWIDYGCPVEIVCITLRHTDKWLRTVPTTDVQIVTYYEKITDAGLKAQWPNWGQLLRWLWDGMNPVTKTDWLRTLCRNHCSLLQKDHGCWVESTVAWLFRVALERV